MNSGREQHYNTLLNLDFGQWSKVNFNFCDRRKQIFKEWLLEQNALIPEDQKRDGWPRDMVGRLWSMTFIPNSIGETVVFTHLYTKNTLDLSLIDDEEEF